MFVTLHEMAHLMTESLDAHKHTREFWSNFRRLLEDASKEDKKIESVYRVEIIP
jgi:predicted metal-dependent hydrolase